jgi:hypothetical protein
MKLGERLGFDSAWLRHRHLQFEMFEAGLVLEAEVLERFSGLESCGPGPGCCSSRIRGAFMARE